MLYTSKFFEHTRDILVVYSTVAYLCLFSVLFMVIFSFFDLKYGNPGNASTGGSSIKHEGEKIDCMSWNYLNNKFIWVNIINTWFA